jgi:hypothetical protein
MHVEETVLGCVESVCPVRLPSCGPPRLGVDTSENKKAPAAGVRVGRDPKNPPDVPGRMGTCIRQRFLEAMVLDGSAVESLHTHRTLCEPRPNA